MTIALDRLSPHPDRVYTAIMDAHAGLTEAQSHALNARLVLMMATHDPEQARRLGLQRLEIDGGRIRGPA